MKKLLVVALIALFMAGSVYAAGPTGPNSPGDILGQAKYQWEAHKIFRLVYMSPNNIYNAESNGSGGGVTADSVVVWDSTLDDGVSVMLTTTSGDGRVAGVLVTAITSNDPTAAGSSASDDAGLNVGWGWMQTYGLCQDVYCEPVRGITVGDTVCAGPERGSVASWFKNDEPAVGTNANAGILGCALDAASAGGTLDIFITRD